MQSNFKSLKFFWTVAFLIATVVLANSHFQSASNDSKYYSAQVVSYQHAKWAQILTQKWGENYWGFNPLDYNFDNFPGQLSMGILVTHLGAPANQALHILGMAFQILSIFLLVHIAAEFMPYKDASILFYSILFTPLAFSYNIRANHELGIMFFSLLSLFAGLRLQDAKWWGRASMISAMMLLWIKGPFFIFSLILTSIGFIFSNSPQKNIKSLIVVLLLSSLCVMGTAFIFETYFLKITGQSFLENFWKIQIESRSLPHNSSFAFLTLKIHNFYYYFYHFLVYALPWTLILIIFLKKNKNFDKLKTVLKSRLSWCLLLSAFSFLCIFTMNSRYAARYVFPAYYLFSAWVICMLFQISDIFKRLHQKISELGIYFIAPTIWLIIFSLHFL